MRIYYPKLRSMAHLLSLEFVHCSERNLFLYFYYIHTAMRCMKLHLQRHPAKDPGSIATAIRYMCDFSLWFLQHSEFTQLSKVTMDFIFMLCSRAENVTILA